MWVHSLKLKSVRNYLNTAVSFSPGLNVVYGQNGEGKTTLLESVEYLASGRSLRARSHQELIRWQDNQAVLHCSFMSGQGQERTMDILLDRAGRREVKTDGAPREQLGEWIGTLKAVAFFQLDLQLISGEPLLRRRFLNVEISKANPGYLFDYAQYKRCLHQRNAILKEGLRRGTPVRQLEAWEEPLTEYGTRIAMHRLRFLRSLTTTLAEIHRAISGGRERLSLRYVSHLCDPAMAEVKEEEPGATEKQTIQTAFGEALRRDRAEEMRRGTTLVGPHRDDLHFLIHVPGGRGDEGTDLRRYGSQGQQRTAALATKLATARCMLDQTGDAPAVLLDDVLSELDGERRQALLSQLTDFEQCILTTTDRSLIPSSSPVPVSVYQVREGKVQPAA